MPPASTVHAISTTAPTHCAGAWSNAWPPGVIMTLDAIAGATTSAVTTQSCG